VNNINIDIEEKDWGGCIDRIDLTLDRVRWTAFVNTVMNLGFHKCWEAFE
jgi:hypothetical protein